MAITEFQREICRLIAHNRKRQGVSYISGGVALNMLLDNPRLSRDIDIFSDRASAVREAWDADRSVLETKGFSVETIRLLPTFIEAKVQKHGNTVLLEWAQDSAFRFFPLSEDDTFGLTLHPFDLATNKTLALAGRLEVRDWIDLIHCHDNLQNAGYLFWAACGKDPGFNPSSLLTEAKRSGRYTDAEIAQLIFEQAPPRASVLGATWKDILRESAEIIETLPEDEVGTCVLDDSGELFRGSPATLKRALKSNSVRFHTGTIHGAFPKIGAGDRGSDNHN